MKRIGRYVLIAISLFSCKEGDVHVAEEPAGAFTSIPSSHSRVTFANTLSDSEYFNIIKYGEFYNGGGVAIGDINNDGLPDIYFSSNQWENKLYLNKGDFEFTDITAKAGVSGVGNWKTGVTMTDVNGDGLLDIYVCTGGNQPPFQGQNQLYINNGDLTFTDRATEYGLAYDSASVQMSFHDLDADGYLDAVLTGPDKYHFYSNDWSQGKPHFVESSNHSPRTDAYTGIDFGDVNEDGLEDAVKIGRFPYDDKIIKTTSLAITNKFEINQGKINRDLLATDAAAFAGIAATDHSWAALLADFDNDGKKDLFATTGVPGRANDLDYIQRISDKTLPELTVEQRIKLMPSAALPNFFFRNVDGLRFENVSESLSTPGSFSGGAAYGDLDNDGDLDLVVNNINAEAFILRNNTDHDSTNYISIKLEGAGKNRFGLGTLIKAYAKGKLFSRQQFPVRGWLSSVDPMINIGLGKVDKIDSLIVIWRNKEFQKLTNLDVNQTLVLKEENTTGTWAEKESRPLLKRTSLFSFKHVENSYSTLNKQPLIPHASSTKGPKMAVTDLNGDRIDDVYICGGQGQPGAVFVQTRAGKFVSVPQPAFEADKQNEEISVALFDVDGDRDADLMIGSGGEEFLDKRTMMRLYLNNGRGTFVKTEKNLPKIYVNASCIVPADVDNDGDMDAFVGGGVITGRYGFDSDSFILTNDGKGVFTGSPASFFERRNVGDMIQAAVWIDVNQDEYPDLVTAGDWTQIQVWINEAGVLKRQFKNGIDSIPGGWWTTLASADMDNDGDDDLVAGNFGTNQRIQAAELSVADLDNNGSLEPLMSYSGKPLSSRDVLLKQIPALENRYPTYAHYADATIDQIVTGREAFHRSVGMMHSVYIENLGNGNFKAKNLPSEAQFFPIFGIKISDVDGDGNKDILLAGNLKAVPNDLWRHDNGYGLLLMGDGKGNFKTVPPMQSGFIVEGEGRDIQSVKNFKKEEFYLVTRNNDSLFVFKKKSQ